MKGTGEAAAVLAAALVWLALLAFPIGFAVSGTQSNGRLIAASALLLLLIGEYVWTAIAAAKHGAPRPAPIATVVVAGVAVLLPLVGGSAWLGATVFLAALFGVTLPVRQALAGTAAATGLAIVQAVAADAAAGQALSVSLITAVAGVVVVVVVRQTVLARELAASRRAVAAAAAQDERLRLARELHDSVKQQAFVAALELGSARARLGPDAHLDAAADAVATAQRQLGEVIEHLRPASSGENGELAPTLRRHVELWSRRTGVPAELIVNADRDLPAEPLLTVATEALTNVARHSGARHVKLVLQAADGQARLTVVDDGHGFDQAATAPGQGLRGMAERLAQRRGELDVRSGPAGTTLVASYPET